MNRLVLLFPSWTGQALRFGLVGLLNTGLDLVLYTILTRSLSFFDTTPVAAKIISYSAGIINSYFLNRCWTFRSRVSLRDSLPLFCVVNCTGLGINALVLHALLQLLNAPEWASLSAATASSLLWNFSISKIIIFDKKKELK